MKVLILGGYGVFGGRLARLLIADGVDVTVAGRDIEKATAFTNRYGGTPLYLNRARDLTPIARAAPAVAVDAVGPFQAYGADPYRVPHFCIEHGISYLDLSDDGDFTAGIRSLDDAALAAGCYALSGASSVPAISAAAVRALSPGFTEISVIETAIIPGNRAPRGRSLVAAILNQTGEPLRVWRGGAWRLHRGWADGKTLRFGPGLKRRGNLIGVPDLILFPQAFGARSVLFRAGLELSVMHRGLAVLGYLRGQRLLPPLKFFLGPIYWMSRRLESAGSDRGAMAVSVTGLKNGKFTCRRWQVVASNGDGPFIPAVPARAAVRRHAAIAPGARPCLELSLPEIERAMTGLAVEFETSSSGAETLFQRVLGEKWDSLPGPLQRLHSVQDIESFEGKANVTRGQGAFARIAAWCFGLPRAGREIAVTVTKIRRGSGEVWERNFAGRTFRSYLTPSSLPFRYCERFSAFNFELKLEVKGGCLTFKVCRGWFLGVELPRFLLPESETREYEQDGVFRFDVGLYSPFGSRVIVRYQGYLKPEALPPYSSIAAGGT